MAVAGAEQPVNRRRRFRKDAGRSFVFTFQNMSYGSTLAWLLFLITLVVTLALFGTARKWVFYAGEAR